MEFRVLGPTELWSAGRQCDLGPARERSALAILLLTPRTIVPSATLIDRLWDTRPPPKARESLSVYIARLRASLRHAVGDGIRLAGRANGYVLDVDPEAVDLHRFRRLRRQADALTASGDGEHAVRLLHEADELWHGQALAGIRGDWVGRMRDGLEEERRAAIMQRVGCELELGRHADLVGELQGLLAHYPLDETFVAYQMTALYRSGRPADALSLYRDIRGRLADELGAEPGQALADLHQRILRNDPGLTPRPPARPAAPGSPPDTLAPEVAPVVRHGRDPGALAGETADPGERPRISAIEGVPGEAKTALAVRATHTVADRYLDGAFYLNPGLAGLVEEMSRSPVGLDGGGAAGNEAIAAFDRSYRALEPCHQRFFRRLAVNPCDDAGTQAAAALGGCTPAEAGNALAALVDGGLLVRDAAGRLRLPALVRGYAAARAARDDPAAERRKAVGRLLDYYLHAADQADRMLHPFRQRMPVTVTRPPSVRPALGSQQDAAAWLEAEWRNILQAAWHAGRHEWQRQCADLVHVLAGFVAIRAYWDEAIEAHTLALQACRELDDPPRIAQAAVELSVVTQQTGRYEATLALAEEAAAIYRALGDRRGQAAALDQIGLAYLREARSREALAYFREAEILYRDVDRRGEADALSHSGVACWQLGHYPDAEDHLRRALSLYRDAGDRRGEAQTLNNLGKMQLYFGLHRDALENYQKSLDIFTELGAAQYQAIVCHNIGSVHHYKGSYHDGLAAYRQALDIYHAIGDRCDEADVLNDIGAIYQSAECYGEAAVHYEQARLIAEDIGNLSVQVAALRGLADVRRGSGQYGGALDHYRTALRLAREIADPYEEAKALEGIAEATLSTQGPYAARIVFRQALEIFERLGVPEAEAARIRIETTDPAFVRRSS
jgi:DNA-binding SARP family transcriptional activator/tetratricopeptide (TPR) repeat protein